MLPTSGHAHVKGKEFGDKSVADTAHQNSPFRDIHKDGHDLNESYKMPVAGHRGVNESYMHPLVGGAGVAPGFPARQGAPIAAMQTGKGKG